VQTALDYRVVCFTLFVATLTGFIFGTAPAWQMSRCDVNAALKDETTIVGRDRIFHLRDLLAGGQIAICFVLLIGAGLCLRSFAALSVANPGFDAKDLVVIPLELNGHTRPTEGLTGPFYQELAQRLESLPGIHSVSFAEYFPMLTGGASASIPVEQIEGYVPQKDEFIVVEFGLIGPKYFETMGIPLVRSPDTVLQGGASLVWINEAFALCATLLAGLGIYGVMSYLVTQRTRDIGIRMALGARRGNVVGLVLRHGMLLTVAGIVAGLLGALASTHVLTSVLYQTRAVDPLTFAGITLLLIAVASFACWWPARRAAKVDPMQALRTE